MYYDNSNRATICFLIIAVFSIIIISSGIKDYNEKNTATKKILIVWKIMGGRFGRAGNLRENSKLIKLTFRGNNGYYIEFKHGAIITSKNGTFYMGRREYQEWKENFSKLGFPCHNTYTPIPNPTPTICPIPSSSPSPLDRNKLLLI